MLRLRLLLPALLLLAFCVRTPTLGLPLEGAGAELAARAAGGDLLAEGSGPLMPALTAAATTLGVSPTAALRWLDAFFAALLAPLVVLLAGALGIARARAALAGLLLALHPLALVGSGAVAPGAGALVAALTCAALAGLAGGTPWRSRLGAAAALLLIVADAVGPLLALPLLAHHVRREPSPRFQTAAAMLAAGLLIAAPLTWWRLPGIEAPAVGDALLWIAAAGLGVLLAGLPRGVRHLAASPAGSTVLGVGLLAGGAALLMPSAPALVVLPLLVLAAVEGTAAWAASWRRRLLPGAVGGALAVSTWLVSGGLQAALPIEPAAAGRLHYLRQAMQVAADTVGDGGWIVLAVGEGRPEEQASLADLQPARWTWVERAGAEDDTARRRLRVFPAAAFEPGRSVAVLAEAGRVDGITTFDGAGIYHETVVREVGPYVVLRAKRP